MSAAFKKGLKRVLQGFTRRRIVWHGDPGRNLIALTFDDGPHPRGTPLILDRLREHQVKATFFVIGREVEKYPDVARAIVREGHEIANHSLTHNGFVKTALSRAGDEIQRTQDIIFNTTGVYPAFFRPPYGILSLQVVRHCLLSGLTVVLWSVDLDSDYKADAAGAATGAKRMRHGDIVLMHDDREDTPGRVAELIPAQRAQGHRFGTLSALLLSPPQSEPRPLCDGSLSGG